MNATLRRCVTLLVLCTAAAQAPAAEGLRVRPDADPWPRWQARLSITTSPVSAELRRPSIQGARLFGDYYFSGPGFGRGVSGGFRATSGLFSGPRSLALSTPTLPARQGSALTLSSRSTGMQAAATESAEASTTVPYLGVGYTGMSLRGGWGFTADVGLMGAGMRLDRSTGGGSQNNVDELLRELRLTPVLQLGVSYSF